MIYTEGNDWPKRHVVCMTKINPKVLFHTSRWRWPHDTCKQDYMMGNGMNTNYSLRRRIVIGCFLHPELKC